MADTTEIRRTLRQLEAVVDRIVEITVPITGDNMQELERLGKLVINYIRMVKILSDNQTLHRDLAAQIRPPLSPSDAQEFNAAAFNRVFDTVYQPTRVRADVPIPVSTEVRQQVGTVAYSDLERPDDLCPICHNGYSARQELRLLGCCRKVYHSSCIDRWWNDNPRCPACRADVRELVSDT